MYITIVGEPRSKQQMGSNGKHRFQSKAYKQWELVAVPQIMTQAPPVPYSGPLEVEIRYYRKKPQGYKPYTHATVPGMDWDNLAKAVCDPCNGRLWVDDKQILKGTCQRLWSTSDSYVTITINDYFESVR